MKSTLIMLLAIALMPAAANAQEEGSSPFGISMGSSIEKFTVKEAKKNGMYEINPPPKAGKVFEDYSVTYHKDTGICKIHVTTPIIITNPAGDKVKTTFNAIKNENDRIYGTGQLYDRLDAGSTLTKPEDWMASIAKDQRLFGAIWSRSKGLKMAGNVDRVTLMTYASDVNIGFLIARYEFSNYPDCKAKLGIQD